MDYTVDFDENQFERIELILNDELISLGGIMRSAD